VYPNARCVENEMETNFRSQPMCKNAGKKALNWEKWGFVPN